MEFRILGPLQVFDDARPLALGGPKQRAVLAHLILRANHTVGAEQLVDGLWGDEPPETARNTLQTYVYRLRKVLGEERLEGRDGGYVLTAAPEEVDAARFEAIVRDAKRLSASDPAAAATRFGDALALWRGAPLDDLVQEPSLRGEIARLEELHLSATEHRIGAEIASGRNSTVVSELEALTARYPLRERMWANLMLALYRGGRQAEALSTYQRARDVLIEELGSEPSTELQRLHERILQRDPSLGRTEPPRQVVRPSRVDLPSGTEFAGYRIVSTLGRGGMSVVYLAEHDWLQRKVALKVLAPQLAEDERFRERFVRESRLAASLDHPNVIPIYEAGASGGDLFIAMRYVEGTDLRTLLHQGGALEPARSMAIVRQVAAALDAAHEQGLVHRDVKPGNVLLARQRGSEAGEHVYLSDFGLTKRSASDSGITGTGQFVGTLDYAAPEQFKGGTADARTDVYSLGCVLFECLTGRPPFASENDAGLMYAHLQAPPPSATAAEPELPGAIDVVLATAMAKAPPDRYQAAGAFADEASRALDVGGDAGAGSPERTRLRRMIPAIAVAVALLAGIALASAFRGDPPPATEGSPTSPSAIASSTPEPVFRTVERALAADEERLLTYIPGQLASDCLPLDRAEPLQGELAALVCTSGHLEVLYELFPTRDAMDAAFQLSADARQAPEADCSTEHLAVSSYAIDGERAGRILCFTIEPGRFGRAAGEPDRSHLEWTQENALIYAHAVRNDLGDLSLYQWWLSSAGPIVPAGSDPSLSAKDPPASFGSGLPDGSYLYVRKDDAGAPQVAGESGITYAVHLEEGAYQAAELGNIYERGTTYLSKPHTIVFVPATCPGTGSGVLRPVEYTWTETGAGVSWEKVGGGTCAGPQFATGDPWTRAPKGRIAVESGGDIALMDAGGFIERKLTYQQGTDPNVWPDWSPDGSRIVFAGASQEGFDLYTMAPDGTGTERITHEPGDEIMPSWSPDGSRIAFVFDDLGVPDFETGIAVVGTSGEARVDLVTRQNQLVGLPIWSPDGTRIAFTVFSESLDQPVAYVMDADGGDLVEVREEAVALSWTPDGKRIVLSADRSLVAERPDGTGDRVIIRHPPENGRLVLDWSPDGRWMVMTTIGMVGQGIVSAPYVYLTRSDGGELFLVGSGSKPSWRPASG
jgi:serine/threonine protein kinase/DNA-binding SARP family transcriptional activator/Tol biopolymer transport system component